VDPEISDLVVQWLQPRAGATARAGTAFLRLSSQVAPGGIGLDKQVYALAPQPGPNQWVLDVLAGDRSCRTVGRAGTGGVNGYR